MVFSTIKKCIQKVRFWFSKDRCYSTMKSRGYAAMGMCGGLAGGDVNSGYLAYDCIGCPYLVLKN